MAPTLSVARFTRTSHKRGTLSRREARVTVTSHTVRGRSYPNFWCSVAVEPPCDCVVVCLKSLTMDCIIIQMILMLVAL